MYIKRIRSNKESFKEVTFDKGFNVVVAERSQDSNEKDSRNGLGKSTLIEIIHFCLGADAGPLDLPELKEWIFTMDFELKGRNFTVSRGVDQSDVIFLDGDFSGWEIQPVFDELHKAHIITNSQWCEVLGALAFNINEKGRKYFPSFRTLISYFARRGSEGYQTPLTFFRNQPEWSKQTNNVQLLGLTTEYAVRFQDIKDGLDETKQIKKVTGQGYFKNLVGSLGELEAERVNKGQDISELKEQLHSFKVHPQYNKIQGTADDLTRQIQELVNTNHMENVLTRRYTESLGMEEDVSLDSVSSVYEEAGMHFADKLTKTLTQVSGFHKIILENRRSYLEAEVERLMHSIKTRDEQIEKLTEKRAEALSILQSHGALEEHSKLSGRLAILEGELEAVKEKIQNLKEFDDRISELEIKKKDLVRLAKQDKEERSEIVDSAIRFFNEIARMLYETGGTLAIDIKDSGYSFKTDIQRGRSQGVNSMKIFCYDLTLAQLQAKFFSPKFLVHDSTVYDGVDERQFSRALEIAATKSEEANFQYICMLNSDVIPYSEFPDAFKEKFEKSIKLRLKDGSPEGTLLGFRFD